MKRRVFIALFFIISTLVVSAEEFKSIDGLWSVKLGDDEEEFFLKVDKDGNRYDICQVDYDESCNSLVMYDEWSVSFEWSGRAISGSIHAGNDWDSQLNVEYKLSRKEVFIKGQSGDEVKFDGKLSNKLDMNISSDNDFAINISFNRGKAKFKLKSLDSEYEGQYLEINFDGVSQFKMKGNISSEYDETNLIEYLPDTLKKSGKNIMIKEAKGFKKVSEEYIKNRMN